MFLCWCVWSHVSSGGASVWAGEGVFPGQRTLTCMAKSGRYASSWNVFLLPPAMKLGLGYISTGICDSVHRGGVGGVCSGGCVCSRWGDACSWGCLLLGGSAPGEGACFWGGCLVPGGHLVETPQDGYCCVWYASYWNVFLLLVRGPESTFRAPYKVTIQVQ